MPSWNIHTAHVERLLREEGAEALGIRDVNAFLLGNFAPDIYVGYMVPSTTYRIDYKLTHLAQREHIPLPRHDDFWDFYVARQDHVSDLTLGAWAHMACDHVYNAHTRTYLARVGVKPGEKARVGKQGRILERDARAAVDVAERIVEKNREEHVTGEPDYQLLTADFFEAARQEAHETVVAGLRAYAATL